MKITVTHTSSDLIFVLDVAPDLELENFKVFCEVESGIPANQLIVIVGGKIAKDESTSIKDHGMNEGDVVMIERMPAESATRPSGIGGGKKEADYF